MSLLETIRQVVTPGSSYPLVRLFPNGPIGNDVGLTPGAMPGGGAVPEPQVADDGRGGSRTAPTADTFLRGAVGTANFAGFIRDLGEYNPILEGRSSFLVYEKMRRSDADVRAALLACKLPIRAADYQISPASRKVRRALGWQKRLLMRSEKTFWVASNRPPAPAAG